MNKTAEKNNEKIFKKLTIKIENKLSQDFKNCDD